jgi:hypothetical protein
LVRPLFFLRVGESGFLAQRRVAASRSSTLCSLTIRSSGRLWVGCGRLSGIAAAAA